MRVWFFVFHMEVYPSLIIWEKHFMTSVLIRNDTLPSINIIMEWKRP